MEWIIIFAIASAFAVVKGVGSGAGAIRQKYRDHIEPKRSLVRDAIDQGHAGVSVKSGEKLGAAAAATVTGLGLAFRAFGSGMKSGWRLGKQRGHHMIDRYKPADPEEVEAKPGGSAIEAEGAQEVGSQPEPVDNAQPQERDLWVNSPGGNRQRLQMEDAGLCTYVVAPTAVPGKGSPNFCGKEKINRHDKYCWDHTSSESRRPVLAVVHYNKSSKKEAPMSIATQTGGEVLTEEQFEKEMEGVIAEATAELDDAQGDAKRAVEDTNRVEMMSACMASLNIDPSTVAAVRALADTNSARLQNAQARVAAAELRMSAAQKALATFRASAQKTFYAS